MIAVIWQWEDCNLSAIKKKKEREMGTGFKLQSEAIIMWLFSMSVGALRCKRANCRVRPAVNASCLIHAWMQVSG